MTPPNLYTEDRGIRAMPSARAGRASHRARSGLDHSATIAIAPEPFDPNQVTASDCFTGSPIDLPASRAVTYARQRTNHEVEADPADRPGARKSVTLSRLDIAIMLVVAVFLGWSIGVQF